jgi:hypothetical protein
VHSLSSATSTAVPSPMTQASQNSSRGRRASTEGRWDDGAFRRSPPNKLSAPGPPVTVFSPVPPLIVVGAVPDQRVIVTATQQVGGTTLLIDAIARDVPALGRGTAHSSHRARVTTGPSPQRVCAAGGGIPRVGEWRLVSRSDVPRPRQRRLRYWPSGLRLPLHYWPSGLRPRLRSRP